MSVHAGGRGPGHLARVEFLALGPAPTGSDMITEEDQKMITEAGDQMIPED